MAGSSVDTSPRRQMVLWGPLPPAMVPMTAPVRARITLHVFEGESSPLGTYTRTIPPLRHTAGWSTPKR